MIDFSIIGYWSINQSIWLVGWLIGKDTSAQGFNYKIHFQEVAVTPKLRS